MASLLQILFMLLSVVWWIVIIHICANLVWFEPSLGADLWPHPSGIAADGWH